MGAKRYPGPRPGANGAATGRKGAAGAADAPAHASQIDAAGHFDALAVHPAEVIRHEGRDHMADIVGRPTRPRAVAPAIICSFRHVAHRAAAEIGLDGAGRDRIDADAARAQLRRHIASEHSMPPFMAAYAAFSRHGEAGEAAGQIHDGPAIGEQRSSA